MFDVSIVPVRRALLSVSDKTGLVDLARGLNALGIELVSTGGTAQLLRDNNLPVAEVSSLTGFPEIMDGRVKTLHPRIHGGLLARRGIDEEVMAEHGIEPIDLLVVNLYPFERAIEKPGATTSDGIENIDIGGPAMLRAAAKNHQDVATVVDPGDYADLLEALAHGGTALDLRRALAAKVFAHTARYDGLVASWMCAQSDGEHADPFPPTLHLSFERRQKLRYGENPHQSAALYVERQLPAGIVAGARLLAGKELSYNNLGDADAALECVKAFSTRAACVIVKHGNPCGAALGDDPLQAYDLAHACDPTSAFGGVIAFNQRIDAATAAAILERQFVELIVAPEIDDSALPLFANKPNVRVMATGWWPSQEPSAMDYKRIAGGLLMQDADRDTLLLSDLKVVTRRIPDAEQLRDLLFAWHVAMYVKSNAIVYARDSRTVGIGAGQMSRIDSARIAVLKAQAANLEIAGSVMASDAFFPFRDSIDAAAEVGVDSIIQPGGSMRDPEVIAAADEHDMIMVFTGVRHFRH